MSKQNSSHPNTKHGMSKTPEYEAWYSMKYRCDPKYAGKKKHKYHSGIGVKVCPQWQNSFETFIRDLGPRPSKKHTLDRKEPDGNYTPENCRWAIRQVQGANSRKGNKYGYIGITYDPGRGKPWKARIRLADGRKTALGYFETPEEAAEAYVVKAKELYGVEAMLNFFGNQRNCQEKSTKAWEVAKVQKRSPSRK